MACLTNYTVQCRDVTSGQTGCFIFDTDHWQATGEFKALSPVFPSLVPFYEWCNQQPENPRRSCYLERNAPAVTIEGATGWPCNDCGADYKAGASTWREVDQSFYETMRDCVPPEALGQGLPGFMVSEPYDHNEAGAVHLVLVHWPRGPRPRYFARYLPRRAVREPAAALLNHLRR